MNNRERELWIRNDEGLYRWWMSTHMSMAAFIKENKEEIDKAINRALNPKQSSARYW